MRARAQLVAQRRRVVGDNVRLTTRLPSTLQNYFPHALPWLQDTDTLLFCDCLSRWPTLNAAQLARRSPLETFCRDHHVRASDVIDKRSHAIHAAAPLTIEAGGIAPHAWLVQALGSPLRVT